MAQYEITAAPMIEAGETLSSIADALGKLHEQLSGIASDMPEVLRDVRQQITAQSSAIEDHSSDAKKLGHTLQEITEIYARAEQTSLGEDDQPERNQSTPNTPQNAQPPPIIHKTHRILLTSEILIPDWLQAATIKYEQMN